LLKEAMPAGGGKGVSENILLVLASDVCCGLLQPLYLE